MVKKSFYLLLVFFVFGAGYLLGYHQDRAHPVSEAYAMQGPSISPIPCPSGVTFSCKKEGSSDTYIRMETPGLSPYWLQQGYGYVNIHYTKK